VADRVFLHIGAPKSGSTYLQTILWANKVALRRAGVLVPGERRSSHGVAAVWARTPEPTRSQQKTWHQLSSELAGWPSTVILSSEWFTRVPRRLIPRLLDELRPAEINIVFTARNLAEAVPAAWQERLKLGDSLPLDGFLESMRTHQNWSWRNLDARKALPKWEKQLGPEMIHLVTVPPRDAPRDLLWNRFAAACDVDPSVATLDTAFANASLSAEGARLLELMGPQLRDAVDADIVRGLVPHKWIRDYLSHTLLAAQNGHPIALLESELQIINARSRRLVDTVSAAQYQIHGDLNDLLDGTIRNNAVRPDAVDEAVLLKHAMGIIPPMLGQLRNGRLALDRERKKSAALSAEVAALREKLTSE